jgi:hypothetical protein
MRTQSLKSSFEEAIICARDLYKTLSKYTNDGWVLAPRPQLMCMFHCSRDFERKSTKVVPAPKHQVWGGGGVEVSSTGLR